MSSADQPPANQSPANQSPVSAPETLADAHRRLTATFRAAGIESAALDSRRLIEFACGLDGAAFVRMADTTLSPDAAARLANDTRRRLALEPVARIIGERWFYGRSFRVTPATLDPRPESETIVDAVRELQRTSPQFTPQRILDIGTGTGCLLLTLLAEWPTAIGVGTDISRDALAVAAANADRLGLADRSSWIAGDGFAPLSGRFDLIVSNPPYIPTGDIAALDADVRDYDPMGALDGGADGLAIYRRLCAALAEFVTDGWVIFEVGAGQADAVAALLQSGLRGGREPDIRIFKDLAGVDRCVAARPRPA